MKAGEFPDGTRTLRAKIDMASPNLNMRDPVMYRILHAEHHRTGRQVVHLPDVRLGARPGLDRGHHALDLHAGVREPPAAVRLVHRRENWGIYHPQQIEFARLNLTYTVMSKRKLLQLVQEKHVAAGTTRACRPSRLRRRGYTPEAIRASASGSASTKFDSTIDMACWSTASARTSTSARPRAWPCSGR
jgi:glutaminyl-tRNA synthetase